MYMSFYSHFFPARTLDSLEPLWLEHLQIGTLDCFAKASLGEKKIEQIYSLFVRVRRI